MCLTVSPLSFIIYPQNKCYKCTAAINKQVYAAIEAGETVSAEDYSRFSMEHDGKCSRKTTYSTAAAEEYLCEEAARDLLLKDGKPRDESTCVFMGPHVIADNDSKAVTRAIRTQQSIIGPAVDGKARHVPDLNHVVKNNNNDLHSTKEKDPSFRGKAALTNQRITSIAADIMNVVKDYHEDLGNPEARQTCLNQLDAIPLHHSGDHSSCKNAKYCTTVRIQSEHPDWNAAQVAEQHCKETKRFNGTTMDLSNAGKKVLQDIIAKRFNADTIDSIAECGCSNKCEGFWGQTIKHSEGKRILGNGSDLWYMFCQLCFCNGNGKDTERTREDLSKLLNIEVTPEERKEHEKILKKRKSDYERHSSEKGKMARRQAKITSDLRTGKQNSKSKDREYKTEKNPLGKKKGKVRKAGKCTKCHHVGHTKRDCVFAPAPEKQKVLIFDWDGKVLSTNKHTPRYKVNKPIEYDWSLSILNKK